MSEPPGPRREPSWPFYATCAVIALMGVFLITATDRPLAGYVFVGFAVVCVVGSLVRAGVDRCRGHH